MKTFAEQIADLKATRLAKHEEMKGVAQKSIDEGRSMDTGEAEQFDTLELEIKQLDGDIGRLSKLADIDKMSAKAVDAVEKKAEPFRMGVQAKNTQKLAPGIAFARAVRCYALSHMEMTPAKQIAERLYGNHDMVMHGVDQLVTKAAVSVGTTASGNWGTDLVGSETTAFADFVEFLRPQTIVGRFGTNGVPALRQVPFRTALVGQTAGGDGYWTGEAAPKGVTSLDFDRTTLEPLKVANIIVVSDELIRGSSPSADVIIRASLADALSARIDADFINPANNGTSGVKPAAITNGIGGGTAASGTDADAVRADVKAAFTSFLAANNTPSSGVWIMPSSVALSLSMMTNALGQLEFPGISMTGGFFAGLPVIVSDHVPVVSAGAYVALVNSQDIYLGDEGGLMIDITREASIEMQNGGTLTDPAANTAVFVNLFQRNLVGFRAERILNWKKRRASAVALLKNVKWGG